MVRIIIRMFVVNLGIHSFQDYNAGNTLCLQPTKLHMPPYLIVGSRRLDQTYNSEDDICASIWTGTRVIARNGNDAQLHLD